MSLDKAIISVVALLVLATNIVLGQPAQSNRSSSTEDLSNSRQPTLQRSNSANKNSCTNGYNFDFFTLNLQYEAGLCAAGRESCAIKPRPQFSIHGLWPDFADRMQSAEYCCGPSYNRSFERGLDNDLSKNWTTLTNNPHFWAHEWKKHGLCATKTKGFETQTQYFRQALDLFAKLSISENLKQRGISASNQKPVSARQLSDALSAINGNKVASVRCEQGDVFALPVLTDIKLCFTRELKPADCVSRGKTSGSCLMPESVGPGSPKPSTTTTPFPATLMNASLPLASPKPGPTLVTGNTGAQGAWASNRTLAQKIVERQPKRS